MVLRSTQSNVIFENSFYEFLNENFEMFAKVELLVPLKLFNKNNLLTVQVTALLNDFSLVLMSFNRE